MNTAVRLGFEVGTGRSVEIPVRHMAVTGQTQEAGKTTALEALVQRSGLRAITFVTKRGERAFAGGRRIPPFFRERADWVFVSSLIDATLGEKNKLLRAWLMKVCRNTSTLAEVQRNVLQARAGARGFAESIYTEIEGYLELVVPQLAQLPPHTQVSIGPGLNVMDLSPYSSELQALVIRSVLEHVYEHESGVITVIPEAWEFVPEGRGSPVKRDAETLIRKGASLGNYLWLDSQDLGGVWKLAVRACPVVLIGVQREANEIKRTLANIPADTAKPTKTDIAHLELGQFFACWGKHAIKTYVQPSWLADDEAERIARGETSIDHHARPGAGDADAGRQRADAHRGPARDAGPAPAVPTEDRQHASGRAREDRPHGDTPKETDEMTPAQEKKLDALIDAVGSMATTMRGTPRNEGQAPPSAFPAEATAARLSDADTDVLYRRLMDRVIADAGRDPRVLQLLTTRPEIAVQITKQVISMDGSRLIGRVAAFIAEGFFDRARPTSDVHAELKRRGVAYDNRTFGRVLTDLTAMGFLTLEGAGSYQAVPGMKVHIVEA